MYYVPGKPSTLVGAMRIFSFFAAQILSYLQRVTQKSDAFATPAQNYAKHPIFTKSWFCKKKTHLYNRLLIYCEGWKRVTLGAITCLSLIQKWSWSIFGGWKPVTLGALSFLQRLSKMAIFGTFHLKLVSGLDPLVFSIFWLGWRALTLQSFHGRLFDLRPCIYTKYHAWTSIGKTEEICFNFATQNFRTIFVLSLDY